MTLTETAMTKPDPNALHGTGSFSGFARIAKTPRISALGRARLRGWNDYRLGLPFRDTYDTWSELKQYAYERGRQQAALTQAARPNAPLPKWHLDETVDSIIRRHLAPAIAERIINETRAARKRKDKGGK